MRKKPSTVGLLAVPTIWVAKPIAPEGQLLISWKSVKNVASYNEQQINGSPTAVWEVVGTPTRSKFTVTDLTVGAQYTFRVRALGAAGPSAWSDPVIKKAL